jgi:hypothetical protein
MHCVDCGADIGDRRGNAYLCRSCARARRRTQSRRSYAAIRADMARAAARRDYGRQWAREHYVQQPRKVTIVACATAVRPESTDRVRHDPCLGTFARTWPNNRQAYCPPCSRFYQRELENDRHRRRYARRKAA